MIFKGITIRGQFSDDERSALVQAFNKTFKYLSGFGVEDQFIDFEEDDAQTKEIMKKLPRSVRWTFTISCWFSSISSWALARHEKKHGGP